MNILVMYCEINEKLLHNSGKYIRFDFTETVSRFVALGASVVHTRHTMSQNQNIDGLRTRQFCM